MTIPMAMYSFVLESESGSGAGTATIESSVKPASDRFLIEIFSRLLKAELVIKAHLSISSR